MKQIFRILNSPSARTSATFYLGSFISSVSNYLFHLLLIRLLAPAAYGEFLTYVSLLYLTTVPSGTVSILITKHVSQYYGKKDHSSINLYFYFILARVIIPSLLLGLGVILFSGPLSDLFKAEPFAFVVLGISIVTSLLGSILGSYILAFQQFIFSTILSFAGIIFKILLAFIFIKLGLGATGGIIAVFVSGLVSLIVLFIRIKPAIVPKISGTISKNIKIKNLLTYSLIFSTGTLSLMSADVLLVRLYFSPHQSGLYAGLSMLGRMIYFGIIPLSGLLLPLATSRFASQNNTKKIFYKLGLASLGLGGVGVTIFSLYPSLVISLLSGINYLAINSLLPLFSLSMLIFALNYYLLTYLIAVNKQSANLILLLATLIQPLLIALFHQSLNQVVNINLTIQASMLAGLLFYYKIYTRNIK